MSYRRSCFALLKDYWPFFEFTSTPQRGVPMIYLIIAAALSPLLPAATSQSTHVQICEGHITDWRETYSCETK